MGGDQENIAIVGVGGRAQRNVSIASISEEAAAEIVAAAGAGGGGDGTGYALPVATTTRLGGVRASADVAVSANGTMSVPALSEKASTSALIAHETAPGAHTTQTDHNRWNGKLDAVARDETLSGDGTASNPLRVVGGGSGGGMDSVVTDGETLTGNGTSASPLSAAPVWAVAKAISNPNILINTDGRNQINQRNRDDNYLLNGYGFDRWRNDGTAIYTERKSAGLRLINSDAGNFYYQQVVENPKRFAGKNLTLSARAFGSGGLLRIEAKIGSAFTEFREISIPPTLSSFSLDPVPVPLGCDFITCFFSATTGQWIEFENVKLEEGDIATPWTVPDPAIELMRCQRYYYRFNMEGSAILMTGIVVNQTDARFYVPLPTTMRANPAFSYMGDWYGQTNVARNNFASLSLTAFTGNGAVVSGKWGANEPVTEGSAIVLRPRDLGNYMSYDSEM